MKAIGFTETLLSQKATIRRRKPFNDGSSVYFNKNMDGRGTLLL
jgi:hypothetical protein